MQIYTKNVQTCTMGQFHGFVASERPMEYCVPGASNWLETSFQVKDHSVKQGIKMSLTFLSDSLVFGLLSH